jgi:hypothetical protein
MNLDFAQEGNPTFFYTKNQKLLNAEFAKTEQTSQEIPAPAFLSAFATPWRALRLKSLIPYQRIAVRRTQSACLNFTQGENIESLNRVPMRNMSGSYRKCPA